MTFESWRDAVRPWLVAGYEAHDIVWLGTASRIDQRAADTVRAGKSFHRLSDMRLPRTLMSLLEALACFRHDSRWELMYRLTWRVLYENLKLLFDPADPDVARSISMERAVARDIHKMHAFVRFQEVIADEAIRSGSANCVGRCWANDAGEGAEYSGRNVVCRIDADGAGWIH